MNDARFYPVGRPGHPWNNAELSEWQRRQRRERSYADDVVTQVETLIGPFERLIYGTIEHDGEAFPLLAVRSAAPCSQLPTALITGGVHGYETSGVLGALGFLKDYAADYVERFNLLVVPCVSPWAYERVARWNYDAVDPNRSFLPGGGSPEAAALMRLVGAAETTYRVHVDLHETTDSDASEFDPALAARDGKSLVIDAIPDGFYLVADSLNPQLEFQKAVIASVADVTHIAPADENGAIIGSPVVADGVIQYPVKASGLCTSITGAQYTTTTEVYPDSANTSPSQCLLAQVTAVRAALDFALSAAPERAR